LKKIIFYSLLLASQLLAQQREFRINRDLIQAGNFFNSELHYFPTTDGFNVYYIYKIPYSQLFFEKVEDEFSSGLIINIEIRDSIDNVIKRAFDEKNISVKDFNVTNSRSIYLQGFINIKLNQGKYKLSAIISEKTSRRERKLPPKEFTLSNSEKIFDLIILEPNSILCEGVDSYILSNNSSSIPFNMPEEILAVPVSDSTINSLTINVKRGDTTILSNKANTQLIICNPVFNVCDGKITISTTKESPDIKYFLFSNFSSELTEGPINLEIIPDKNISKKKTFNLDVIWIGKPFSLRDPEGAIKYLKIIETDDKVSELLKKDDLQKALYDYWQKNDPTPNTKYNELMNEFYQRIDYADKHFQTISGNDGLKTDRGKTYIKYGQPDKIERDTNNDDHVVESWYYNNPKRTFVFIDIDGTGKFNLANQK